MHDTEAQDPGIVDGLRHSQERLQFFIDHAPGAMAMLDREMRYLAVNRDWQVHHAPDGRSVLGRCHYDVYPDMKPEWRAAHQRGLAGEATKVEQERVALPDGSAIWLRWEVQPWYEAPGTVGGVVLFVEDITARVQSEEAAQVARQNLADLIGTIDGIVWEADAATFRFTFVSAQAERLLGYPVSAWIDDPGFWAAHIHPVDREASVRYCVECTREGRDHQFDYRMLAADGRVVWLQDRVTVHVVDGRPVTLRGVMVDITERKRAEAALRESEERFRTLADSAPMLVWTSGPDRRCDFFNRRRLEFTGRALDPAARDGWADGLHPDERLVVLARHEAAFEAQAPFEMDYRLQRADGEFRWMSAHAVPRFDAHGGFAGYIGTCVDITERRRAEEMRQRLEAQLRQSQKMEAMGTLAGGIAHDFNNLLAAIGGNLALVAMDLGKSHPAQENLGEMRRAVHRATELVKRILTFSRPETHEQEPVQLGPVVVEAVHLLRSLIPAGIELSHHVAPDLPDVLANASQVHQVIVNLATNAWQAMDGGPGRIDIRLEPAVVDQAHGRQPRRPAARPVRLPRRSRTPGTAWRRRRSSGSSSRSSPPRRRARAPASACRWCTASPAGTAGPSWSRASCERARPSGCCSRRARRRRPTSRNCRPCRTSCAATASGSSISTTRSRWSSWPSRSSSGSAIGSAATRASTRRWPRSAPSRTRSISS